MGSVVLVRHGETTWNRERRVQGWAPVGLAPTGREQATALAEHLATTYDVDRVYTSDLTRALETTRVIRRELSPVPPIERVAAWRERDFGVLQGLSYETLFSRHPEYAVLDAGYAAATARPEGGERLVDIRARVLRATDELVAELADSGRSDADSTAGTDAGETAVVVTHGGPIRFVLAALLGLDVTETITEIDPGNCSVTELRVEGAIDLPPEPGDGEYDPAFPEVSAIERLAATPHLDALADAE